MTPKEVIKHTINMCHEVLQMYLGDLKDADLVVRPVPGANHIAWMMGHMIYSEHEIMKACGYPMPALPEGFGEAYTKEASASDDLDKFHTLTEYVSLFEEQRAATLEALQSTPDENLDKASPDPIGTHAPTIGAMFSSIGLHEMMHAAQFAVIRRKLGMIPLF